MERISNTHNYIEFPAFYNCYPIKNEIHYSSASTGGEGATKSENSDCYLDDYYGRIFDPHYYEVFNPYGVSERMRFYPNNLFGPVVDTFRVPYRKIPVFSLNDLKALTPYISQIEKENPNYEILIRGQNTVYLVPRPGEEKVRLYGQGDIKEPSLLPSHVRKDFDEIFINCMWHSQTSMISAI